MISMVIPVIPIMSDVLNLLLREGFFQALDFVFDFVNGFFVLKNHFLLREGFFPVLGFVFDFVNGFFVLKNHLLLWEGFFPVLDLKNRFCEWILCY